MRFGVLGPLAVWTTGGSPVTVKESKVRALLAVLLINQGRPVSADRLIDDLWGGQLPLNPLKTLQTRVWQLRKALEDAEPGGRDLVVSQPPGYLLRVDPEMVDTGRFRALISQARATGEPVAKARLLSEALELWRGPAFADFRDAEFAGPTVQRLEEQRLLAVEERTEARLAWEDPADLAVELSELVGRHPLRERLRAVHMRALYRAGRQNDALTSYGTLRHRLAEDLGLDPGPELAALHQAILERAPHLGAAPTTPAPRTNLPTALTALVGRADAVTDVRSQVTAARLVTLTGPGGVGKTRLAVEVATQLAGTFPDGVWLAELAELDHSTRSGRPSSLSALVDLVTTVLGIRADPTTIPLPATKPATSIEHLAAALRARRLLLVLDNCEHVIEPVAELTDRLLSAAPELRILATSRQPLEVDGELLWPVAPLEPPAPGAPIEAVRRSGAVQLFVARATAATPEFTLNQDNADAVATVCRALDGIPLALELAATRTRALGVRELAARVDDRFPLLTNGKRGAPARQRTLRAMIDWSWELLTEAERVVLRRLSVHAGGCTIEAAEETCAGDGVPRNAIVDLLARLVDRSLVVMTETTDGPRYRLLESVAAYCHERLHEAGESTRIRHRHHRYYIELAEHAEPRLRGGHQRHWLRRLDTETANLHRALDHAIRHGQAAWALRLANALSWYWFLRGRLGEARRTLNRVLDLEGTAPAAARAIATVWRTGITLLIRDNAEADTTTPEHALDTLHKSVDDPAARAFAEWFLVFAQLGFGTTVTTDGWINRLRSAFHAIGDRWGIAATSTMGAFVLAEGDLPEAARLGRESLALFEELGDRWGQLKAGQLLAMLAEATGDYEQAALFRRQGLRNAEELGLWTEAAHELSSLGRSALLAGDYATAKQLHTRAMRLATEQSYQWGIQHAEVGLGLGARRQGRLDVAETHLRNWLDWCRRWKGTPGLTLILAELGFIAELRGDTRAALALQLDGYAAARSTGDRRAIALALEGLAGAHSLADRHDHAARLLGAAAMLRRSAGAPMPPAEHGDIDRITARIRQALGDGAFATAFHHGQETGLDTIVTCDHAHSRTASGVDCEIS
ncbi:BTAD domain-containing putative transcriptional regulator [Amycolatopsis keratiniphila]|uniref:ATPase-like protein n=1 Tax=Amycolatopsis keratiniphila TaxID=129921 RepID=R4T173_9PSEU|nr:BTAD domain-containing putative transcriptional regulator [Amycolatopsis keratiniphila]AGM04767.1 ATPase-like protein [Amycolatopsis keratiniphila]